MPQLLLKAIYLGYFTFGFWETWQVSQPKVKVCLEAWRSMGNGQFIYPLSCLAAFTFYFKKCISFFSTTESAYQLQTSKQITFIKTVTLDYNHKK